MSFWSRLFGTSGAAPGASRPVESPAGGEPTEPVARTDFLAEAAERLREARPDLDFTRDVDRFALRVRGAEGEQVWFLEPLFAETRDVAPDARAARLIDLAQQFARTALEAPRDLAWEDASARVVVSVRSASFASAAGLPEGELVARPCVPMLVEVVAIDGPASLRFVTRSDVDRWGITTDELFAAAENRGGGAAPLVEPYDPSAPYAIWKVAQGDGDPSSLLTAAGPLAALGERVAGRLVVAIPHRDLLVVGGDGDEACLRRLIEVGRDGFKGAARPISPALYTLGGSGKLVPLHLASEHPLRTQVEGGHQLLRCCEYAAQQAWLDGAGRERKGAAFVATATLVGAEDGTLTSVATWTKYVESLLPEVDLVAFATGFLGRGSFLAPWSAVLALDPPCLAPEPGLYPPRYRTRRWPTATELEALRGGSR